MSSVNVDELKTHQDFLTQTPQLCQYLFNRSCEYQISILNFIDLHAEIDLKKSTQLKGGFDELMRGLAQGIDFDSKDNLDNAIQKVNLEALSKAANLYALEINRLSDAHYKIIAFTRLRQIPHLPIALNLDTLDKLYRYQSTLQRQLSNCIGELLVLNKSEPLSREINL